MQHETLLEKYPVITLKIGFDETTFTQAEAIVLFLKQKIEEDPIATYIAIFDHYNHTRNVNGGEIAPEIKDALNLIFCFGQKLPSPKMLAVRPRSIGVAKTDEGFVISFMEAPMSPMTEKMKQWVAAVKNS